MPAIASSTGSPGVVEPAGDTSHPGRTDVFISYAREDQEFVRRLHEALAARGRQTWVDWEGIPPTAEWMAEIHSAIAAADSFVFVLSPHSISSRVCREEAEHATEQGKRLIPLVREDVPDDQVPASVAARNWIFFRERDDFDAATQTLIHALDTDLEWTRAHTRLLVRAREWEEGNRDRSFVLRGRDLGAAERWLAGAGRHEEAKPTPLHTEYILESRRAATRGQRARVGALGAGLIVALVLALFSFLQRTAAVRERERAEAEARLAESRALAASAIGQLDLDPELGMLLALEAVRVQPTGEADAALRRLFSASRIRLALRGHQGPVVSVAVDRGGRHALTGGSDGTARLVSFVDGELLHLFRGHQGEVREVAFSHGFARFALTLDRDKCRVWDVSTGELLYTFAADAAAFSPDGLYVATATGEGLSQVVRLSDGEVLSSFRGNGATETGFVEDEPRVHVEFDVKGERVFSAVGGSGWVWDVLSGRLLVGEKGDDAHKAAAAFAHDGSAFAIGLPDGTVQLWDATTGRSRFVVQADVGIETLEFSPDDSMLVVAGGGDHVASVIVATTGRVAARLRGHTALIREAVFFQDGSAIATASDDSTARLWDSSTGRLLATLSHSNGVGGVAFVTEPERGESQARSERLNQSRRLITASADGSARIWVVEPPVLTLGEPAEIPAVTAFPESGMVAVSPDDSIILTAEEDGSIRSWSPRFGRQIHSWKAHDGPVNYVAFHPNGRSLISAGADGTAKVWRWVPPRPSCSGAGCPFEGKLFATMRHSDPVSIAAFSPDGKTIITAVGNPFSARGPRRASVGLWRVAEGHPEQVVNLKIPTNISGSFAFTPGGDRVAVGTFGEVWILDTATGQRVKTIESGSAAIPREAESSSVTAVLFDRSGRRLITASLNGTAAVWDASTGRKILTIDAESRVVDADVSSDGRSMATAHEHGGGVVWDVRTGRSLLRVTDVAGALGGIGYSPDGSMLWAASEDVRLHDRRSGALVAVVELQAPGTVVKFLARDRLIVGMANDGTGWVYRCDVCISLRDLVKLAQDRVTRGLTAEERERFLHEPS